MVRQWEPKWQQAEKKLGSRKQRPLVTLVLHTNGEQQGIKLFQDPAYSHVLTTANQTNEV